jgi:hypothetical protein
MESSMVDDGGSAPTNRKSAVELLLEQVRELHGLARQALAQPKPNSATAKQFMKLARQTGKKAAPFLRDLDFRQRIVSDEPMSEKEWERVWARQDFPRFDTL